MRGFAISLPVLVLLFGLSRPSLAEEAVSGRDFAEEAKLLYRVVACAGDAALPAELDAAAVEAYCKKLAPKIERYRKLYVEKAKPFLSGLQPAALPKKVVYPFGGGDLISALTTYPNAEEITTMSLEHAGDPRRVHGMSKKALARSLRVVEETIDGLLQFDDSKSENLMKGQRGEIPGQLAFFLVALAVHDFEPVGLRYFTFEADGSLHYLSEAEIAAMETKKAGKLKSEWTPPDFSVAFSNSELTFRPRGGGALRVHRHVAANLADDQFVMGGPLLKHLEAKGRVAAMTKAASYLLWRNDFSHIRDYLLGHMELMISDSTGVPVGILKKAGFAVETYGKFEGSFLGANEGYNKEFREAWASQPERALPFRYGYIDSKKHNHLFVARRAPSS